MTFKEFFFGLSLDERDAIAKRADTTRGLLTQVAYKNKSIELGFADVLVKLGGGAYGLSDLPLTQRAARQRLIREGKRVPAKVA